MDEGRLRKIPPSQKEYTDALRRECIELSRDLSAGVLPPEALYDAALGPRRSSIILLVRNRTWRKFKAAGYGVSDIGRAANVHHTTVINSLKNSQHYERWYDTQKGGGSLRRARYYWPVRSLKILKAKAAGCEGREW
jgi:hypothetical protein